MLHPLSGEGTPDETPALEGRAGTDHAEASLSARMHILAVSFAALVMVASAEGIEYENRSSSRLIGRARGKRYTLSGEGKITAVRVWGSRYIHGLQFRYGDAWSAVAGRRRFEMQEMVMRDGECIVQISGKTMRYLESLVVVTNRGRVLQVGRPRGKSFNIYSAHKDGELRMARFRASGPITSLKAWWATEKPEPSR